MGEGGEEEKGRGREGREGGREGGREEGKGPPRNQPSAPPPPAERQPARAALEQRSHMVPRQAPLGLLREVPEFFFAFLWHWLRALALGFLRAGASS